jgi:hypothetical protein
MTVDIPDSVILAGRTACARYVLRATPVGFFIRGDELRDLIAQDALLREAAPWIQVVRPLEGEETNLAEWQTARPEIFEAARRCACDSLPMFASTQSLGAKRRMLVRMAALRRLDASYCGNQTFVRVAELGNEPHFEMPVPGLPFPMKVGRVRTATYAGDPKKDREVTALFSNESAVQLVERAVAGGFPSDLPPRLAANDDLDGWEKLAQFVAGIEPLRAWERSSKLSVLPTGWWFDIANLPAAVLIRPPVKRLIEQTGHEGAAVLVREAGICPFICEPAQRYLDSVKDVCAPASDELLLAHIMRASFLSKAISASPAHLPAA